jgi:HD-GYP domain-containing protein (c-di-GMP phosphodiesterase class II)
MFNHTLDKSIKANIDFFNKKVSELDPNTKWQVKIIPFTETRSIKQNSLSHAWYAELAESLKEETALGYKCFCKLHFATPIMRAEDEEFKQVYDSAIKGLSYEKKLEVMKILPVTSRMSTKQLTQYLDAIKAYFYDKHGLDLKYPDDY